MSPDDRTAPAFNRYVSTVAILALLFGAVLLNVALWHF